LRKAKVYFSIEFVDDDWLIFAVVNRQNGILG